jgi:predicted permease
VLAESLLLLVFLLVGYAVQLAGAPARLRDVVWILFFWTFSPVLVFVTFLTVDLDEGLGRALGAAIVASWLVGLGGYGYARLVAGARDERGALTLAAGFGNTGFVGFPLAQLAYGADGLSLAVLYDRLSWLVPASSVSTAIARVHGRREVEVSRRHRLRAVLANPPLHAFWLALVLRAAGVDVPGTATAADLVGAVIGPYGFSCSGSRSRSRGRRVLRKNCDARPAPSRSGSRVDRWRCSRRPRSSAPTFRVSSTCSPECRVRSTCSSSRASTRCGRP